MKEKARESVQCWGSKSGSAVHTVSRETGRFERKPFVSRARKVPLKLWWNQIFKTVLFETFIADMAWVLLDRRVIANQLSSYSDWSSLSFIATIIKTEGICFERIQYTVQYTSKMQSKNTKKESSRKSNQRTKSVFGVTWVLPLHSRF